VTWQKGTVIELDPADAVYAVIGAGDLRTFVDGTDTVGRGLSN
jgi:hypothetical protein